MRLGFHGRLLGALVLTLAALGAIQYLVLSADTRDRLYEEEGQTQRADAAALSRTYTITVPGEVPLNNVNRYLRSITSRPGSDDAALVDRKGLLLAGGTTLGIGLPDKDSHVARVLRSGKQYVGPADDYDAKNGHIIAVTPVKGSRAAGTRSSPGRGRRSWARAWPTSGACSSCWASAAPCWPSPPSTSSAAAPWPCCTAPRSSARPATA